MSEAGFEDVRTVLASGNALVTTSEDDVAERAGLALRARFEREIPLLVRTQQQVSDDVARCPFPADSADHHAYLVYLTDDGAARELFELTSEALTQAGTPTDQEAVSAAERLLYWWCPVGASLSTPVSAVIEKFARRHVTTTRNARTMKRLTTG